VIASVVMLLIYRLNLSWTLWIGIPVGLMTVYYLNERSKLQLNRETDQIWAILKSPLLKKTKYFITDPQLVLWVEHVSEFKKTNTLEFNKLIANLDRFLKLSYQVKHGVDRCKENLDLIKDIKVESLNQFHSLIYTLRPEKNAADMRVKYAHYLEELAYMLNDRHNELIKLCKLHYSINPVNIDSHLSITGMDEPTPLDPKHEDHRNFYI
jgi:hypothetical protein